MSTGLLDTSHPENDGINKCYLPDGDDLDLAINPGMKYFERAGMTQQILSQCKGKEECRAEIPLDSGALQQIPSTARKSSHYLFAQVACQTPEELTTKRRLWGLTAALLGVWIVFIFRHTLSYMYSMDLINDKLYDLKLITASDYTAAGVISRS